MLGNTTKTTSTLWRSGTPSATQAPTAKIFSLQHRQPPLNQMAKGILSPMLRPLISIAYGGRLRHKPSSSPLRRVPLPTRQRLGARSKTPPLPKDRSRENIRHDSVEAHKTKHKSTGVPPRREPPTAQLKTYKLRTTWK